MGHFHYHQHEHDHVQDGASHQDYERDPHHPIAKDLVAEDITDLILGETFPSVGHVIPGPGVSEPPVDQTGITKVVIHISQSGANLCEPELDLRQTIHLPNHSQQFDLYSLIHDMVHRAKTRVVRTPGDFH